jgi:hypothetical protein
MHATIAAFVRDATPTMSMKKSDLDKRLGQKIGGQMRAAGAGGRFAAGANAVPDRREQRRLDSAAGLVPFACKLPSDVAATLREKGAAHPEGMNGFVAELLRKALA